MPDTSDAKKTFTSAERIQQLCSVDENIPQALSAAGAAIKSLTVDDSQSEQQKDTDSKEAFEAHTAAFYTHIQAISALLHRQVYALEEAGIIAPSATSDLDLQPPPPPATQAAGRPGLLGAPGGRPGGLGPGAGASAQGGQEQSQMQITNGGLGNLDIGWLNARRDVVGKKKENELWKDIRKTLEELVGGDIVQDTRGVPAASHAGDVTIEEEGDQMAVPDEDDMMLDE
jgi:hypothetical protein